MLPRGLQRPPEIIDAEDRSASGQDAAAEPAAAGK